MDKTYIILEEKLKMKKIISFVLAAVLMLGCLALASCGGSSDAVKLINISLTDEKYALGVAKDDAELLAKVNEYLTKITEDGTFDAIINKYFGDGTPEAVVSAERDTSKDQLVVATNSEFAPFEYKEGGNFYGIDMEMVKGLADYLGKELVIVDVDFDAVCQTVESGNADIAAAGLTINETREKSVTFSDSYYLASQVIIVKAADTIFDECQSADDVLAKIAEYESGKIGGQSGTTAEYFVKGDEDWGFDGLKNMTWAGYNSGALAVSDMLAGNISFVIIDKAPAEIIVESVNKAN